MKRIVILITTLLLLGFTCCGNSAYIDQYISENNEELTDVISAVVDYGGSALPYDESQITVDNLIRIYKFIDKHLPNYYNEHRSLTENIIDTEEYKYFSSKGYALYIDKNEEDEWEVHTETNELKVAEENHPEISFEFKDMISNISENYPDLHYESVKYIEYTDLGTFLVYFTSNNTEYLACYPIGNTADGEIVPCGEIYTVEEYIDIIDDFPIFNITESSEGAGGGVGLFNHTKSYNWYVYPVIGISVVLIVGAVGYGIIKMKRTKQ